MGIVYIQSKYTKYIGLYFSVYVHYLSDSKFRFGNQLYISQRDKGLHILFILPIVLPILVI